jgi:hypothetical protein
MMHKIALGALIVLALTVPGNGNFSIVQLSNNTVNAGGFLFGAAGGNCNTNANACLLDNVAGKLLAR